MKQGGIPHTADETVDLASRLANQVALVKALCEEGRWSEARTQVFEVETLRKELMSALMDQLGFGRKPLHVKRG